MKKIILIGSGPHNIGGISIHLRRLIKMLEDTYEFMIIDVSHNSIDGIFNIRSLNLFKYIKMVLSADIVHIHCGNYYMRLFNILMCRIVLRKFTIVTIHQDPAISGHIMFLKYLLKFCNKVILVNEKAYKLLSNKNNLSKYILLPAFLPPIIDDEPSLPPKLQIIIDKIRKDKESILMVNNAWRLVQRNGEDVYGLDLCIDAMIELMATNTSYYLIFVIADNTYSKLENERYNKIIIDNSLNENVYIWDAPISFVKLIEQSDIVLRTTNTDGDALSIREGLFFNKKVIASDVVYRPNGVHLFKNRDVKSLVKCIMSNRNCKFNNIDSNINYKEIYKNIYD